MININALLNRQLIDYNSATTMGDIINCTTYDCNIILLTTKGYVRASKITSVRDAVTAHTCTTTNSDTTLLGKHVYNTRGDHLGVVKDVTFTSTMKARKLMCNYPLPASRIVSNGDVIIVKFTLPTTSAPTPPKNKLYGNNCDFLIGRITLGNITDYSGEVIYRSGHRIDRVTIARCKKLNKLRELIVYSQ